MFGSTKTPDGGVPQRGAGQSGATMIAHGVKVEGEFTSQGDVQIEGEVHGSLTTTGALSIGPESKIKADVQANDVLVAGVVEGNMTVTRRLDIKSTAKISGDIVCETIAVEAGAFLAGHVHVGEKAQERKYETSNKRHGELKPVIA